MQPIQPDSSPLSTVLAQHIVHLPVTDLIPYVKNAKRHSASQIKKLQQSITAFGFTNPILLSSTNEVITGHGRLEAAKKMGIPLVPTIRLDHLSIDQCRALRISDNRLAELADWDYELLHPELMELTELNFSTEIMGFDTPDIDAMELQLQPKQAAKDELPALPIKPVTRLGDIWQIGPHRIICGDAKYEATFQLVLKSRKAEMVITDPPYGVSIQRHVCGLGKVQHREFVEGSINVTESSLGQMFSSMAKSLVNSSIDGSIHMIFMDWAHLQLLMNSCSPHYSELKNICVWAKTNAGMGSLWRSQHELVAVYKNGTSKHINNVELGKHGRYRTNIWNYAGMNAFSKDRDELLASHPTVKPVALVADAIRDCSSRGGLILDPFSGSGTTMIAAHETGRHAAVIELDPIYVDLAITRMKKLTGLEAIHTESGMTFEEMSVERDGGCASRPHHPSSIGEPS
jgi:DNA modification methylase